jgi:hypothetical protein
MPWIKGREVIFQYAEVKLLFSIEGGKKVKKLAAFGLASVLIFAGSALAQTVLYGDENVGAPPDNFDHWKEGVPTTMQATTEDVKYMFEGGEVHIPFTLNGSRANVRLAVYTDGLNPQYDGGFQQGGGPGNALFRASGIDTFIAVTEDRLFSEGSHIFSWDGLDFNGNPIPVGDYQFFLIALNNIDNPTYITSTGNLWTAPSWDFTKDPPHIWWPQGGANGDSALNRSIWGSSYMTNPGTWDKFAIPWMNERRGIEGTFWDISSYDIDPQDPNIHYAVNYRDQDDSVDTDTGIWRIRYDEAAGTLLPDEDWGGESDRGWLQWEGRLPNAAQTSDPHHPWQADDGFLYVAWRDNQYEPFTPGILKLDREAGEVTDIIDFTDIYVQPDWGDTSISVQGPFGIDLDERGFYATGMWQNRNSFPSSTTLDGDILWINQNGDDFTDRFSIEEAEAMGVSQPTGLLSIHAYALKWNLMMASGTSVPHKAELYGPDGAGLLKVFVPKSGFQHTGEVYWMAREDKTDGLYWSSGQSSKMHSPFDIERGTITEGEPTAVEEVASAAVPTTYELKDSYPNPFNPQTTIEFTVPDKGKVLPVRLAIYNPAGQEVAVLADGELGAGFYKATWDGRDAQGQLVASGVYLYQLTVGDFSASKRMTFMK